MKRGLKTPPTTASFPLQTEVLGILSHYGCREIPTPEKLKRILIQVSSYEFLVKPLAAVNLMRSGIPTCDKPFWEEKSLHQLHAMYCSLSATPKKVIAKIVEPDIMNKNEDRIFGYLVQLIGNMKPEELRRFLRFITGSSVLIARFIMVTFNRLDGLSRRPITHTCTCTIELPSTYKSYIDFEEEFQSIITN